MTAREEIFQNLRMGVPGKLPVRRDTPVLREMSLNRSQMVEQFIDRLKTQTAETHLVKDKITALDTLASILREEGIQYAMISTDTVITSMDLGGWAKDRGLTIKTRHDFQDREAFKDAIFTQADAGITGAEYGIAESGTLVLFHDHDQPRLISLAPVIHIAIIPVERIVPVLESVIEGTKKKRHIPSQISFITGPSMTSDIQGRSFKGMHGPKKLMVILVGEV